MSRLRHVRGPSGLLAVIALLALTPPCHGQNFTWLGTTSTDPTVAANWDGTAFTAFGTTSTSARLNIYNGTSANTALEYGAAQGTTTIAPTAARPIVIGNTGNDGGRLRITGGTFSIAGAAQSAVVGTNGKNGTLEITGGQFVGSSLRMEFGGLLAGGAGGTATLTVAGGEAIIPLIEVPSTSLSTATFNLDGGTFTLGTLTLPTLANSSIRFNGGTLRPSAASATFLQNFDSADVRNGGVVIDTNGFATGLPQVLRHSQIGGDAAIDGGLRKLGLGTLTLSAANTFTGPTVVQAGTLLLADALALSASTFDTGSAGTLSFGSLTAATFGGLSGSGGRVLENASAAAVTLSLGGGNTTSSYAGSLSGAGGLTKIGTGTLTLSGTNTYAGNTAVNAGTLAITAIDALPGSTTPGRVSVAATATLMVPNAVDNAAVDAILANATFASDGRIGFDTSAGDRTYATAITGSKGLVKAGGNTLTISGSNTLGAIRVMGGTLKATAEATWGGSGGLILNDATFEYAPPTGTSGNLSRTITLEGNGSLRANTPTANIQFNVNNVQGPGQLTLLGGGGLFVRASGTYTGGTVVKPGAFVAVTGSSTGAAGSPTGGPFGTGTLRLEGGGFRSTTGSTTTVGNVTTLAGNVEFISAGTNQDRDLVFSGPMTIEGATRTLTVNMSPNTGAGATGIFFNGVVSDGGNTLGLTKAGPGTLVLAGNNTYGGATTVSAGTLRVNGNQSAAIGAMNVASGATLGGSGTIGGAVSILGGGIVAPGTSPGTLTVSNAFSLAGTSILSFEFNAQDTTVGGGINDLITGVTSLTLDGILNVTGSGDWTTVANNTTWRLFDYTGSLVDNGLSLGSLPTLAAGQSFQIDTATTGQVNLVVVPEPSGLVLLALAAGLVAWSRRRR